jgi:crotonobetainyl-CoA:carnitine CoA-transferase CaiB-like acyl-CoA transferase
MVAALTPRQFADLATMARLARTFAFLERLLPADFSTRGDLYTHRATLAALLAPWFARRTVADLATAFAGTSVPWTHADQVNTGLAGWLAEDRHWPGERGASLELHGGRQGQLRGRPRGGAAAHGGGAGNPNRCSSLARLPSPSRSRS